MHFRAQRKIPSTSVVFKYSYFSEKWNVANCRRMFLIDVFRKHCRPELNKQKKTGFLQTLPSRGEKHFRAMKQQTMIASTQSHTSIAIF